MLKKELLLRKMNINKILKTLSYYILILLGLFFISWMIWARFIRDRTIRNIPDDLLTEVRFWILVYICCIYIYVIKSLIKKSKANLLPSNIIEYIWKPAITLDHTIKYNRLFKHFYYKLILIVINSWFNLSINGRRIFLIGLQIVPRIILVIFLVVDTFYFNKLEIFYKVILLGTLPLIFRYLEYCLNDIYDHWVEELNSYYDKVQIFEKGYSYDISRVDKTEAFWHYEKVTIDDYIEILFDSEREYLLGYVTYEYTAHPFPKKHIYRQYEVIFGKPTSSWNLTEYNQLDLLFEKLMPDIIKLRYIFSNLSALKDERKIKWMKIGIFTTYLICWAYILIVSYHAYPIELHMFNNILQSIIKYLMMAENPFEGYFISLEETNISPNLK